MKSKKGAIEDFGELFIAGLVIALIIIIVLFYISQLNKSTGEMPDVYVNDLEAMQTTRMIIQWQYDEDQKVYEKIVELYNDNKKTQIIDIIKNTIKKEIDDPGDWIIALGEHSKDQIHGAIGLSENEILKMEGSRIYLPKTKIPNPQEDEPILILIKKVTGGDYANINRGKTQQEIIEMSTQDIQDEDDENQGTSQMD